MSDTLIAQRFSLRRAFWLAALIPAVCLSACATSQEHASVLMPPHARIPTEQYPMTTETSSRSINLRINPDGLSENQRRALDQIAEHAGWTTGGTADVSVQTAGSPGAMAAGHAVSAYLVGHDVPAASLSQKSVADQPADIITVTITDYRAHVYDCNRTWENLSATRNNNVYGNFGCALSANLAAQVADPRDLSHPASPTSSDATRKSTILTKYRTGEVTSAAQDDQAKGTISDAIK